MFEKFMCKTRFTINVNLIDIITFIITLIGLSIIMTTFGTKIIVGYNYSTSTIYIWGFIYIITYLSCVYLPTYFVLKPRKTKHTDKKTV